MLLQGERKGHWNDIEFMGKTVSLLTKGAVGMNRRITVKYCFLQGGYWTLAAVAMAFTTPLLEAKRFFRNRNRNFERCQISGSAHFSNGIRKFCR